MWRLGLLVGIAAVAFGAGWTVEGWRQSAAEVKQIVRTVTIVQHDAKAAVQVATQVQAGQDRVRYVHDTITREVHDAVPPAADPDLGVGFVRLWNAAALGVPPAPASAAQPDDAPSGAKASDALGNWNDNARTANACLVQLRGFQDWARAVGLADGG